jgi:hypothetical protein
MAPNPDLITSASMVPAPMTHVKLNGKNYVYWSRSVEVYLRGKGLYSHLQLETPPENSSTSLWDQADNQIISLMLNSIEPHIGSSCLYLPTAKAIWDHLEHMYSGTGNITRIYEVCKQYFGLEQGTQTIDEYYNQVIAICKERDMYQPLSTDLKKMEKQRQDVDVVRFLLSLKPEYESVRAQILGGSDLPLLSEVFSRLQRATITDHGSLLSADRNGDRAAFIAARGGYGSSRGGRGGRGGRGFRGGRDYRGGGRIGGRGPRKCTHCGRTNHSVDFCWDLHGTPSGFATQVASHDDSSAPSGPPVSSNSNFENDLISIPKDEYAQFLAHKRASTSSTATLAQSGTASHCLLSSTSDPWVIDSGANDHMTGSSTSLSNYHPVATPKSVTLANGSLSKVVGSGTTHLSPDIELSSVLHVPGFPFNLLSISKITKA